MYNGNHSPDLNFIAACLVLILNVSYVAYSYYQTSQAIQTKREALFLQTKKEINEALQHFSQYLNLTEARLSHSLDNLEADPEAISLILAEKIEESLHKNFPTLEGFSFFPTEHSGISYTKFGKTFHKEVKKILFIGEKEHLNGLKNFTIKINIVLEYLIPFFLSIKFCISISLRKRLVFFLRIRRN